MSKNDMTRTSDRKKLLLLTIICFISFGFVAYCIQPKHVEVEIKNEKYESPKETPVDTKINEKTPKKEDGPLETVPVDKKFSTSIAYYIIVGADQKMPQEHDLRGKFWEFQLKGAPGKHIPVYVSNGPLEVNGVKFMVLPEKSQPYRDSQFCIRTPETWKHYWANYNETRWYFRGTHDTFVNVTALMSLIEELESKYDPLTEFAMAFNFHEYGYRYYPHGGTGWLFSNYAMKVFNEKIERYQQICASSYDDVALSPFLKELGVDIMTFQSHRFIVTWPNSENKIIYDKEYHKVKPCPEFYHLFQGGKGLKPCPARLAASIHMHKVPMDEAYSLLGQTPEDFAITYLDPNTPTFCKMTDLQKGK